MAALRMSKIRKKIDFHLFPDKEFYLEVLQRIIIEIRSSGAPFPQRRPKGKK